MVTELLRVQHEPLQTLLRFADTWHALPAVSDWVVNTIEKGYMLQFACRPTPLRQGGDVSGVRPEGPGAVDGNPIAPCQTGDRGGTPELRKSSFNSQ